MSKEIQDRVVAELRARNIKLWLAPYIDEETRSINHALLQTLAEMLHHSTTLAPTTVSEIQEALCTLQSHALDKLRQQHQKHQQVTACIKVLGLSHSLDTITPAPLSNSWAHQVELKPKTLTLVGVHPQLTVSTFVEELKTLLQVPSIRLLYRGMSLASGPKDTTATTMQQLFLRELLLNHESNRNNTATTTTLLCIVSYESSSSSVSTREQECMSEELQLIASIRQAATNLASTAFEVTDQYGNLVSMIPKEGKAFLTALGLHSIGKNHMQQDKLTLSLVFLLQADEEWNDISQTWRERVDNYGLLQLDIAWLSLKLESLDTVEHVSKRLEVAETVLRKQVHPNFVTLALVQADLGNPVPPLAAVFCRLFLLQGIAYHYHHQDDEDSTNYKAKERLEWAYALCCSLRSVASSEAIASLTDAVGITNEQAISALRRSNGDLNQAAELVRKDKLNAIQLERDRALQSQLGLCQNAMDHVDLDLMTKLQTILGLPSSSLSCANDQDDDEEVAIDDNTEVAAGLLRCTNNNFDAALDMFYQDCNRNEAVVLQRVLSLDQALQVQGISPPAKRKRSTTFMAEVDQVALTSLVSMGVQESLAKKALQESQMNVELALLWLTNYPNETVTQQEQDDHQDSSDAAFSTTTTADDIDEPLLSEAQREQDEARDLLKRELGHVLQEGDLENEYLGNTLDEEWAFLQEFRSK